MPLKREASRCMMDLRLFQLPQTVVKHLGELCAQCLRTVRCASAPWQQRGACLHLQTVRSDWAGMVLSGLSLAEIKKLFGGFCSTHAMTWVVCYAAPAFQCDFVGNRSPYASQVLKKTWPFWGFFFGENTPQPKWQVWAQEKLGDEFVPNVQLLIYSGCYAAKQTAIMKPKVQLPFWLKKNDVGFSPRSIRYNCGFALCKSNSHGINT